MKHKTFDTVLFQPNPPRKRCQMRILPKKCLTDNGHDSIPRLQKNSSPQAPLPRWTKIKMERFVAMSSPSSFCDFSHRWPSKNLRQLFLLVNSLARCSHSRSLTSLSRTNKLIWEGPQKWKMKQTSFLICAGRKGASQHFGQVWLFLFLGQPPLLLVFLPTFFKHPHLLSAYEKHRQRMRKHAHPLHYGLRPIESSQ